MVVWLGGWVVEAEKAFDQGDEAAADVEFGKKRPAVGGCAGTQDRHDVRVDREPGAGRGDVVGDDEVQPLARELVRGACEHVVRFRRETAEDPVSLERPQFGEDVGIADEAQLLPQLALVQLARRGRRGAEVRDGGGHDERVRGRKLRAQGAEHLQRGLHANRPHAGRRLERGRTENERHLVPRLGGGPRDGDPHAAGRAVREEPDRIDRFARGAGGDEQFHGRFDGT